MRANFEKLGAALCTALWRFKASLRHERVLDNIDIYAQDYLVQEGAHTTKKRRETKTR